MGEKKCPISCAFLFFPNIIRSLRINNNLGTWADVFDWSWLSLSQLASLTATNSRRTEHPKMNDSELSRKNVRILCFMTFVVSAGFAIDGVWPFDKSRSPVVILTLSWHGEPFNMTCDISGMWDGFGGLIASTQTPIECLGHVACLRSNMKRNYDIHLSGFLGIRARHAGVAVPIRLVGSVKPAHCLYRFECQSTELNNVLKS